jgi:carbon-monoxide dehydrogenase iron sulfur subunit
LIKIINIIGKYGRYSMKKLVAVNKDACMACLACANACSEAFYKRTDVTVACIQIGAKKDGSPKVLACPQCGKCAEVCEAGAITQNAKGVYMVNKKKCTGCGKCVEACPFGLMVKAEDSETASKCIACGICVKACPMDVLTIKED